MAISFSVLTEGSSDTDQTSHSTASVSPAAGSVVFLCITNFENSTTQPRISSVTGCGLTWTIVREQDGDNAGSDRSTVHLVVGTGTPSSGAITINWATTTIRRPVWIVVEATGVDTTTPVVQDNGITQASSTSGNVSFASAFGDATNNATLALYHVQNSGGTDFTTVDANLTKLTWESLSFAHLTVAYKIGEEANVDGSWPSGRNAMIIAEIKAASGGGSNFTESPVDNVGVTDSVAKTVGLGRTDNVSVTDSIALERSLVRSEDIGITDVVAKSVGKSVVDNVGITDSIDVSKGRLQNSTDNIGLTDFLEIVRGINPTDSIFVQDTITLDQGYTKADTVGITDSFSAVIPVRIEPTDAIGITDSVTIDTFVGHVKESFMSLVDDKREICIAYLVAQAVDTEANLRRLSIHDLAHMYWSHKSGDFAVRMTRSIEDHANDFDSGLEGWDWLTSIS